MNSGLIVDAADEIEALQLGIFERCRHARHEEDDHRQQDQNAQADLEGRKDLPGGHLPPVRPARQNHDRRDGDEDGDSGRQEPLVEDRTRNDQPAIAEIGAERQAYALARARQDGQHRLVPEQKLQQHRDVAQRLDIDGRDLGDQPVLRQAGDAQHEADDRGEDDAQRRNQQRVEQADQKGLAVGRFGAVGDQRLQDVETGARPQEAEAGRDVGALQVFDRVGRDPDEEGDQRDRQHRLKDDAAKSRIVDQRRTLLRQPRRIVLNRHLHHPLAVPACSRLPNDGRAVVGPPD